MSENRASKDKKNTFEVKNRIKLGDDEGDMSIEIRVDIYSVMYIYFFFFLLDISDRCISITPSSSHIYICVSACVYGRGECQEDQGV